MPADWGRALQVGGVGLAMVFIILTVLYLALWLSGRLGAMFSPAQAEASDKEKKIASQIEPKRDPVSGG